MMSYEKFSRLCAAVRRIYWYGGRVDYESDCNLALLEWAAQQRGISIDAAIQQIDPENLPPQFLAIFHYKAVDDYRKVQRLPKQNLDSLIGDRIPVDAEWEDVEEQAEPRLPSPWAIALENCFRTAKPETREAVVRHLRDHWTCREIAEELGLTQTAVETRISRFRRKARREYRRLRRA